MSNPRTRIPKKIGVSEARSNFGEIVRRASGKKRERFLIGLRGQPKAVVMGLEDYLSLIAPDSPLMAEIHAHSVSRSGDKITMDEIDAEIAAFRAEEREKDAPSVRCA